jgi:hypothetical protein
MAYNRYAKDVVFGLQLPSFINIIQAATELGVIKFLNVSFGLFALVQPCSIYFNAGQGYSSMWQSQMRFETFIFICDYLGDLATIQ